MKEIRRALRPADGRPHKSPRFSHDSLLTALGLKRQHPAQCSTTDVPPAAPVAAAEVSVFNVKQPDALPEGIRLRMGPVKKLSERLEIDASHPMPEEPHRLVGGAGVLLRVDDNLQSVLPALTEEAGRHGANAIVVEENYTRIAALALRVSSAQPRMAWPSAAELLETETKSLQGFSPEGNPVTMQLQGFQPVEINAKKGRCYGVIFALDTSAAFTRHARKLLGFELTSQDAAIKEAGGAIGTELPLSKRSHPKPIGCPNVDGPLRVDLQAQAGSAISQDKLHDLGTGPIVVKLFSRAVKPGELESRAAERQKLMQDAKQRNQSQARDACFACRNELIFCSDSDPARCQPFLDCLSRRYVRVEECKQSIPVMWPGEAAQ